MLCDALKLCLLLDHLCLSVEFAEEEHHHVATSECRTAVINGRMRLHHCQNAVCY